MRCAGAGGRRQQRRPVGAGTAAATAGEVRKGGGDMRREQGLKFRRNSAKNFVFASYREKKFGIFRKISFENSKFKKFRPKYTEIRRKLPKFRFR